MTTSETREAIERAAEVGLISRRCRNAALDMVTRLCFDGHEIEGASAHDDVFEIRLSRERSVEVTGSGNAWIQADGERVRVNA